MRHWWACRISQKKLGCNAQLIVDEFGEKLLEELDYLQEARNIQVQFSALTPIAALVQLLFLYCKPLALAEHTSNYFCITSFQQFSRSERPDLPNINGAILHTNCYFGCYLSMKLCCLLVLYVEPVCEVPQGMHLLLRCCIVLFITQVC